MEQHAPRPTASRPRRPSRYDSIDPMASVATKPGEPDPALVRAIVQVCGRTDRARAVPFITARLDPASDLALDELVEHLSGRARRLLVAVWAAGGDPTFLDGAARLVPGVPPVLGPEIGRILRRRSEQPVSTWRDAAQSVGGGLEDVAVSLGALVESLIDDLALALQIDRADVESAVWAPAAPAAAPG
jgi:hypothetical protein